MKKTISIVTSVIMLLAVLFTPYDIEAKPQPSPESRQTSLLALMPESFVVEQTATLSDGTTITVYYKRDGNFCEVYSEDNLKGYKWESIAGLKSTNFRIVSTPKGKRVYRTTIAKARKIVKNLVNSYL